jgi:hypothetical protein
VFGRKKGAGSDDGLDRAARMIIRSAGAGEKLADEATRSPFLYARIRAAIAEEQRRRADSPDNLLETIRAARRAIPAMAFVALISVGVFWVSRPAAPAPPAVSNIGNNTIIAPDPTLAQVVPISACSISNKQECAVSTEEVLATMVKQEGQR